ncbi:MAG: hypothetical protein AAFZ18_25200 [Myxococcota bacterium]
MHALRCLSIVGLLLGPSGAALAADPPDLPDQVQVLRSPASTQLRVRHLRGDAVAELTLVRPPADAAAVLAKQKGPFVREVEHISQEGNELRLLLRLTTGAAEIKTRRIRRPSAWTITFTPRKADPFPPPGRSIGHLPGLVDLPHRPVLFPLPPRDTPCAGNPDGEALQSSPQIDFRNELDLEEKLALVPEPICRSWVTSRFALRALEAGRSISAFERWAFLFAINPSPWALHRESYAQASLVVSEVLTRLEYLPEARGILADADRFRPRHAPFRVMALANHFSFQDRFDEAETLYAQLVAEGFKPWTVHRASLARVLNALLGGDTAGALAHTERAARVVPRVESLPGDLWVVGGEAALAREELALARGYYDRAARSSTSRDRAFGLMRLADLEVRARRIRSARKGWAMAAAAGGWPCLKDHLHLRRVLVEEKDRKETQIFLEGTSNFSRCPAVRMEADYAQAAIHLYRGEEQLALAPTLRLIRNGATRWGPAGPHRATFTEIGRSAVARLTRYRNPANVVAFFERELEPQLPLLDERTRFEVARAYVAIEAPMRGAIEMLNLLTGNPRIPFRRELLFSLGEAFLAAGDTYRTDLIIRHLQTEPAGNLAWRRARLEGRYAASLGRDERAISALRRSMTQLPAGDRRAALSLDLAQALVRRGRLPAAADAVLAAASSPALPAEALAPPAIHVLSECARTCSTDRLRSLTNRILATVGRSVLSPRLVALLARRGVLDATAGDETSPESTYDPSKLWSRLDQLEAPRENP